MATEPLTEGEPVNLAEIVHAILTNWREEWRTAGRQFLDRRQGPLVIIQWDENAACIRRETHGSSIDIAQISREGTDHGTLVRDFARAVLRAGDVKDVILLFSENVVLRPHVAMPRARKTALMQALRYEIERLSPVDASTLYWDFQKVGVNADTGLADIELRIVQKALIDEAVTVCHAAGLVIAGIRFQNDERPADSQRLPVDRTALLRYFARRFGFVALSTLALLLVFTLLSGVLLRNDEKLNALNDAVIDASLRAARVEKLQTDIDQTATYLSYAVKQKQKPMFMAVLADLTRALPDGTSVTEIAVDGNKMRIQGNSTSASDLIGQIDRAPRFANATFDAPLVRDATSNTDHFDLSFDVRNTKP